MISDGLTNVDSSINCDETEPSINIPYLFKKKGLV